MKRLFKAVMIAYFVQCSACYILSHASASSTKGEDTTFSKGEGKLVTTDKHSFTYKYFPGIWMQVTNKSSNTHPCWNSIAKCEYNAQRANGSSEPEEVTGKWLKQAVFECTGRKLNEHPGNQENEQN